MIMNIMIIITIIMILMIIMIIMIVIIITIIRIIILRLIMIMIITLVIMIMIITLVIGVLPRRGEHRCEVRGGLRLLLRRPSGAPRPHHAPRDRHEYRTRTGNRARRSTSRAGVYEIRLCGSVNQGFGWQLCELPEAFVISPDLLFVCSRFTKKAFPVY